jgi:tetratricopeptide (TPR) repeat protein
MQIDQLVIDACSRAADLIRDGHYHLAEEVAAQVLRVSPEHTDAMLALALARAFQGDKDNALLTLFSLPQNHRVLNNVGIIYAHYQDHNNAIEYFRKALTLSSDPLLFVNLALEFSKVGDHDQAIQAFAQACESNSEHAFFNYGTYLYSQRQIKEAKKQYELALSINPEMAVAQHNIGACQMMLGENGWDNLESRWKAFPRLASIRDSLGIPPWSGEDKTLVFNEQGVGDFVQFSRYIPLVLGEVYVAVEECLRPLAEAMNLAVWQGEEVKSCVSVSSLPRFFPMPQPLSVTLCEESWPKYDKFFKIGLCWSGSPLHPDDENRSIALRHFADMSRINNTKWFAIGKAYGVRRKLGKTYCFEENAEKVCIVDMQPRMTNFLDVAAVIARMDAVITVDTAAAHIAGTLGKPTWLLLPWLPDWRWGLDSDRTKWYSSVKIIRQRRPGDWSDCLMRVHAGLLEVGCAV